MKKILLLFVLFLLSATAVAQITITNDITSNTTWSASNVYILDGLIFVDNGAILTIDAGTVIKGKLQANITTGDGASALIIRRDAQIMAEGDVDNPIIFTSELDDVTNPTDLTPEDRGLWGGLILLGKAVTNQPTTENQIEGIPVSEDALFGGNDDSDNSGVLKYISIRHGGFSISGVAGDEINGLTLGAIGNQTVIEHIEVFSNFDDGYEFFGGTVNTKWLVSAYCGDDGFDWDMGYRGKGQFWFVIQGTDEAGRGAEMDGGDDNETGLPYATPMIVNATYIGAGATTSPLPGGDGNDHVLIFRDNSGGYYYSSIFTDFSQDGIQIEDLASGEDSRSRLENGDLMLSNNFFWSFGNGNTIANIAPQDFVQTHFTGNNNKIEDPVLNNISRDNTESLDPRPDPSGPATAGAIQPSDPFFDVVDYYGAFAPNPFLWTDGWTALSSTGITDVKESYSSTIPADFTLTQNYPNPFNPSTKINYSISNAANVTLKIFNILGQEVAVLVDGFREVGNYEVNFEASDIPTGIYIYSLKAGSVEVSKKMTLIK
jgi:hypothetical protein